MSDFAHDTLPYCSFDAGDGPRVGVGVGTRVVDLADVLPEHADLWTAGTLDPLLAAGPDVWAEVRAVLLAADLPVGVPVDDVRLVLPFTVADYVDFYASEHHATNVGRIFRPDGEPLTPNWHHLPIGYHGRAGTVVVSGTPIRRPAGQQKTGQQRAGEVIEFGPSRKLDLEAELGFVVGTPSTLGEPVSTDDVDRHVFGVCVVNDWSARDVQAWEYVPLGPFLGKSFATSVSPWVVPLAALDEARVAAPERVVPLQDYLVDGAPWGLDLELVVSLNGTEVSRAPFRTMYWTGAQMLAHLTANGASLRTGDLFASGTVSGPEPGQRGSLLELTWNGTEPISLADGSTRAFLEDGDEVVIAATARLGDRVVSLGEVAGRIEEA